MKQRHNGERNELHHQQQRACPTPVPFHVRSAHPPVPGSGRVVPAIANRHAACAQCSPHPDPSAAERPAAVPAARPSASRAARPSARTWRLAVTCLLLLAGTAGCQPDTDSYRPLLTGDAAPAFAAAGLDGDSLSLADLRGHAVLLNVWATWCGPCREEMPGLEELHRLYGDRGLRVVGVSIDSRGAESAIRSFLADHDITFEILHDPAEQVQRQFRTRGVPETFLVDPAGVVVHRWIGKFDPLDPAATARVEAVLPR